MRYDSYVRGLSSSCISCPQETVPSPSTSRAAPAAPPRRAAPPRPPAQARTGPAPRACPGGGAGGRPGASARCRPAPWPTRPGSAPAGRSSEWVVTGDAHARTLEASFGSLTFPQPPSFPLPQASADCDGKSQLNGMTNGFTADTPEILRLFNAVTPVGPCKLCKPCQQGVTWAGGHQTKLCRKLSSAPVSAHAPSQLKVQLQGSSQAALVTDDAQQR